MRFVSIALLCLAIGLVTWVRLMPLSLDGADRGAEQAVRTQIAGEHAANDIDRWIDQNRPQYESMFAAERERRRDFYSFETPDGIRLPYLGGFDSYLWLRAARNVLRHGSPCDSVVDGECRDDFTLAPVGVRSRYASSLHVSAIVGVHRAGELLWPEIPLSLSAFLVSVLAAAVGVVAAFLLGHRFGGAPAGFLCAILCSLNPTVLYRSFGADNDIWNVVLPLWQVWAAVEAIYARSWQRRAVLVGAAALAAGIHAAIWAGWIFTCGIVFFGLTANAFLWLARRSIHGRVADNDGRTWQAVLLAGGYLLAATMASMIAGVETTPLAAATEMFRSVPWFAPIAAPVASAVGDLQWPNLFDTVGELRNPSLGAIAHGMTGPVYFFIAWLGLLLLMLPRSGWNWWHFAILIAGNALYRFLLTRGAVDPWTLVALLLLPLCVALAAYVADRDSPVADQGAGLMIILWFLAALVLAHRGNRFLIILAPPMAILCAVSAGRLYSLLERQSWATAAALRAAAMIGILSLAYPTVSQAVTTARRFLPIMNDTWHDALERLRDETPSETVVNTWWDYGYFAKHIADRRVLADGGTLSTRVHYWFAKALISDNEAESVGLLRMLNCGSDATPEPEGQLGAFAALRAGGLTEIDSHSTLIRLAALDGDEARRHLQRLAIAEQDVATILQRTHCAPPAAYLVLPNELVRSVGWRLLGGWSFLDVAAAATSARGHDDVAEELAARFSVDRSVAEEAVSRVAAAGFRHPAPPSFVTAKWSACSEEDPLRCEIGAVLRSGKVLRAVVVPVSDPAATRLVLGVARDRDEEASPASVLAVTADGIRVLADGDAAGESVLLDLEGRRVLVGSRQLLRSTFTHLHFLDGRFLRHFETFDRREALSGELRTWRILW